MIHEKSTEQVKYGKLIMTESVYNQISETIGKRNPECGGILGSSDGLHIDHYYFDESSKRTSVSYTMDVKKLNKVIHHWNDNDVDFIGIIHSHPPGYIKPSCGDKITASHIIDTLDVKGCLFTPIVQVSPRLDGTITIYPYTFEKTVELHQYPFEIETEKEHDRPCCEDKRELTEIERIKKINRQSMSRKSLNILT